MTVPVWRQRNFMLLWGGQLGSWLGTEVSGIAVPLLVLALTGSPALAGAIAGVRGLVYVVWAIPAGVVIDRCDRKFVMSLANLGSGLALGSVALALALDRLSIAHLFIATAVEGSFFVFANLGRFAAFPRVVPKEQLPAAAAGFGMADHIALLGGPPLGGFLYGLGGAFVAFALDALSYAANAASILLINVPLTSETAPARRALREELAAGLGWLWRQPVLRFITLVTAGRTFVVAGLYLLVVVIARDRGVPPVSIGLIFALGAAGGLACSLVASRIHARFGLRQLLLGTTALTALIFGAYAAAASVALLALVTALYYAVDTLYTVTTSSYSATITPDAIRGRVVSLTRLTSLGAHALGFLLTGLLLEHVGSAPTIGLYAALLLGLFLLTAAHKGLTHP
jgi:MFS family permease